MNDILVGLIVGFPSGVVFCILFICIVGKITTPPGRWK